MRATIVVRVIRKFQKPGVIVRSLVRRRRNLITSASSPIIVVLYLQKPWTRDYDKSLFMVSGKPFDMAWKVSIWDPIHFDPQEIGLGVWLMACVLWYSHGGLLPGWRFPYLRMTGWHRAYLPLPLWHCATATATSWRTLWSRLAWRGLKSLGHVRKKVAKPSWTPW